MDGYHPRCLLSGVAQPLWSGTKEIETKLTRSNQLELFTSKLQADLGMIEDLDYVSE